MADLTKSDVLKLAQLSKLNLTEDEIKSFQKELSDILGYVEKLNEVDVTGLEPTTQVTGLTDVMRPDVVKDYGTPTGKLLQNVPDRQGNSIKVRRVL